MANAAASAASARSVADGIDNVIQVEDLRVQFRNQIGTVNALNRVSFSIPRGKVLGVVGESGCGKSITGLSIMQLVPHPGKILNGRILFREKPTSEPKDLLQYDRHSPEMHHLRG